MITGIQYDSINQQKLGASALRSLMMRLVVDSTLCTDQRLSRLILMSESTPMVIRRKVDGTAKKRRSRRLKVMPCSSLLFYSSSPSSFVNCIGRNGASFLCIGVPPTLNFLHEELKLLHQEQKGTSAKSNKGPVEPFAIKHMN